MRDKNLTLQKLYIYHFGFLVHCNGISHSVPVYLVFTTEINLGLELLARNTLLGNP